MKLVIQRVPQWYLKSNPSCLVRDELLCFGSLSDGMMEGSAFSSVCCCCTLMCKDEKWILRRNTLLKAPVPISVAFHSLTEKQVCAANSAGSLSQSQTPAFKAREKRKKQNAIVVSYLKVKVRFCVVYLFFSFPLCWVCATASTSCVTRAWSFLTEIDHPYLLAAAVLQVVSSHRTTCSCFQTPLWNSISFPQFNSLLCFCKSFRHSFPVSCQFPEMVLTWWKSLTPQGCSTLAHVGC